MKKIASLLLFLCITSIVAAQDTTAINKTGTGLPIEKYELEPKTSKFNKKSKYYSESKHSVSIGYQQGGGGYIGGELEYLFYKKLGVQVGAGYISYCAGINYHFRPNIKSTYFSFQYLNHKDIASLMGASIVYRGKRWLTTQVGLGFILSKGPSFPTDGFFPDNSTIMLYSIGAYFPL